MQAPVWLGVLGLASGATATWSILEMRPPLATLTGAFAWTYLAFRGGTVTMYSSGSKFTASYPGLQWFMAWLAVVNLLGLALWWWGDFPPDETSSTDTRGGTA